jgi:hypothetical protein
MRLGREIRTACSRSGEGLFFSPLGDSSMVAGKKDFGHFHASKFRWAGVLGVVKNPFRKGFFLSGNFSTTECTGKEANHGIGDDSG